MEFRPMPKTPRLSREVIITEKIDGTNASVYIELSPTGVPPHKHEVARVHYEPNAVMLVYAGSRTRWITPEDDNYGFARWVRENAEGLVKLGPGHHFGEWWGSGINRNYGLKNRRFSLFNVERWSGLNQYDRPMCCDVVPILHRGPFNTLVVNVILRDLAVTGSLAAPGFMDPEGIMVYHTAANALFKKTIKGDEEGKHAEAHPKKEKQPKPPRDPNTGGRRKGLTTAYAGPERRRAA